MSFEYDEDENSSKTKSTDPVTQNEKQNKRCCNDSEDASISQNKKAHRTENEEQDSLPAYNVPEKDTLSSCDDATSKDYYFDSYSHYGIHEEMLKDRVRTETYQSAILNNSQLFKDKIVLDVGTGTGILSMFACQAGAKHVYGIDMSNIIDQAKIIVEKNGFADRITLIKGKVEEIELPVEKVDIIISEWMGYFLLYESMLDTVIFARDKWLIPNGVVFPDKAQLYLAAMEDGHYKRDRIDFWNNVYGFDYSPIRDIAIREPIVDIVEAKSICSDSVPILDIDILTCTKESLSFKSQFCLTALRNDYVHGLVAYFECAFTQIPKPVGFSTSPLACYTHWKQTLFYMEETLNFMRGEQILGHIACKPNEKNNRDLDITISIKMNGMYSNVNKVYEYNLR
jgi:protein arginine N-methyltransferase 1